MTNQELGVDEIVELYLDQLLAKEDPDKNAIVEAFPEFADDLDKRLRLVDLLYTVGKEE